MLIYCNIPVHYDIEDAEQCDILYDEFIFSNDGIFTKYKKHFYEMDLCNDVQHFSLNQEDFFVQKDPHALNKNKIITTIPYKHYYVKRKTIRSVIDDDLTIVKEVDNDAFITHYFLSDNSDYSIFEKISSFLKKNV